MAKIRKQIGVRIRLFRERRGLTQDELGVIGGMHRAYVGHIERGEKNITIDSLVDNVQQVIRNLSHVRR